MVIVATFGDYGVSWDEELHVPYGRKLLAYYTSGFADRSAFSFVNLFQYGGAFDLTAAIAERVSPLGVYETRHLLGGFVFLAGLFGAWRLTRLLAGDRAALIAVVCLATTPLLYGHSFINPKDAPLAWLGVWVAYFACRAMDETSARWRTIVGLGISLGLALGTRIIAFAFIGQLVAVLFLVAITRGLPSARRLGRPFAMAMPIAFVVMAMTWPWAVQEPLNILSVVQHPPSETWHPTMWWAGELVKADDLPRSYLLVLVAVGMPEYILVGVLFVIAGAMWRKSGIFSSRGFQYLFVASTVVVPLAAFAVLRPTTYNGLRHFLFLVPQLVILGAIGLDLALSYLAHRSKALAGAFAAAIVLAAAYQVVLMARLHPYQYLAFNTLTGGVSGAFGRFELDYWAVSYGEAARGLLRFLDDERAAGRPVPAAPRLYVCAANTTAAYYLPPSFAITDDPKAADFFMGGDLSNPRCPERPSGPIVVKVSRADAVLSYVVDLRGMRF